MNLQMTLRSEIEKHVYRIKQRDYLTQRGVVLKDALTEFKENKRKKVRENDKRRLSFDISALIDHQLLLQQLTSEG